MSCAARWLALGFLLAGLLPASADPDPREVTALVRELASRYSDLDGVDYDVPIACPEMTALFMAKTGGMIGTPELRFRRHDGSNGIDVRFPALPEMFQGKAEAQARKELEKLPFYGLLRDLGWTMVSAFLGSLDDAAQYELLDWSDSRAVVEYNDLSEPFAGNLLRSLRLTIDRPSMTIRVIEGWIGRGRWIRIDIEHETGRFFPETKMPLVKTWCFQHRGMDNPGPAKVTITAQEGTYRRSAAAERDKKSTSLRARLARAGLERFHIDSAHFFPDGTVALDLSNLAAGGLPDLSGLPISSLNLADSQLSSLAPLRGLTQLRQLDLSDTPVADLSPLEGLPIERLNLTRTRIADPRPLSRLPLHVLIADGDGALRNLKVLAGLPLEELSLQRSDLTDLEPLRGLPLRRLNLSHARFQELAPLAGLPLVNLDLSYTPVHEIGPLATLPALESLNLTSTAVEDLSSLAGLKKLRALRLSNSQVRDLTPLRELPLRELAADSIPVSDLRPLLACLSLERVSLPFAAATEVAPLKALAALREISFRWDQSQDGPGQTAVDFWKNGPAALLPAVQAAEGLRQSLRQAGFVAKVEVGPDDKLTVDLSGQPISSLSLLHGWPIARLRLIQTPVRDLSPLRGLPLEALNLAECKSVRDLSPLADLPLTILLLNNIVAPGMDLAPLRRLPLRHLDLSGAEIDSLDVVAGMPLKYLNLAGCQKLRDLTPLRGKPLEYLHFGYAVDPDLAPLADLPLHELYLHGAKLKDTTPILHCRELEKLTLPADLPDYTWVTRLPRLREVAAAGGRNFPTLEPAAGWPARWEARQKPPVGDDARLVTVLREMGVSAPPERRGDGTWSVNLNGSGVKDLAPLAEFPISGLSLHGMRQTVDLSAIDRLPLTSLTIIGTRVEHLPALGALKLQTLTLGVTAAGTDHEGKTNISDLSPLRGLRCRRMAVDGAINPDVTPLLACPDLEELILPSTVQNLSVLRRHPRLRALSLGWPGAWEKLTPVGAFWQEHP